MHKSSYEKMKRFVKDHLDNKGSSKVNILDFGSRDVNGCYRSLFSNKNWNYTGMDIEAGKNVDLVIRNPHDWREIKSSSYDVVVSGQALEHIEFPWDVFKEIRRILKSTGIACIIAPSAGPEHRYPIDCWRIYPDGMLALCKYAGLECLNVYTDWEPKNYADGSEIWKDTVLVAKKTDI
jgi:SAM-dependent methyltransferase